MPFDQLPSTIARSPAALSTIRDQALAAVAVQSSGLGIGGVAAGFCC